jgi:hypothetical protein
MTTCSSLARHWVGSLRDGLKRHGDDELAEARVSSVKTQTLRPMLNY